MSEEPEFGFLGEGMAEEIITLLAQSPILFVVARNSSFAYKNQSPDIRKMGRELGVRYVLEGSLRKIGSRIRVTAQLVEAETGAHKWADRYDRPIEDIFDLQDEVCVAIARVLDREIMASEIVRAARMKPENLGAWGEFVVGRGKFLAQGQEYSEVLHHLRRAIELDPGFARAHSSLAVVLAVRVGSGMALDPAAERAEATAMMDRARHIAPDDPYVLIQCANTHTNMGEARAGLQILEGLKSQAPSIPDLHAGIGFARVALGEAEAGTEAIDVAIRQSPRDTNLYNWFIWQAQAATIADDLERAADLARAAGVRNPDSYVAWLILANALSLLGRDEAARAAWSRVMEIVPGFSLSMATHRWTTYYEDTANAGKMLAGLPKLEASP